MEVHTIKISSFHRKLFISGIFLLSLCSIFFYSFEKIGEKFYLWLEAEDTEELNKPLTIIEISGASGNKGIFTEGGAHLQRGGYAKYTIQIPTQGDYTIWGRTLWAHACSNSFKIGFGNSELVILGGDPLNNEWHWIPALKPFYLKKGQHTMYLWNDETGSKIDKFLLTSDKNHIPVGVGSSSNYIIDFEDEQLPTDIQYGNIKNWSINSDTTGNHNIQMVSDTKEHILLPTAKEEYKFGFTFDCKKSENTKCITLYYAYNNETNFKAIGIYPNFVKHIENSQIKNSPLFLKSKINLKEGLHSVTMRRRHEIVEIKLDGLLIFKTQCQELGKLIGIGTASKTISFDNIYLINELNINYQDNFHMTGFNIMKTKPELSIDHLDWIRYKRCNHWNIKGTCEWIFNDFESIKIQNIEDNAFTVFGEEFWDNYYFDVALRAMNDKGMGICFNFQDPDNYNIFKWIQEDNNWYFRIIQKVEGQEEVLIEKPSNPYRIGKLAWYKIGIINKNGKISFLLDDNEILKFNDSTFMNGKIGFWSPKNGYVSYDDINIRTNNQKNSNVYSYLLNSPNMQASKDVCDWEVSPVSNVEYFYDARYASYEFFYVKNYFEEITFINKKYFLNNFSFSTQSNYIPKDVNICYEINKFYKGKKQKYELILTADETVLLINKKRRELETKKAKSRQHITITNKNNILSLQSNGEEILTFIDDNFPCDSVQLSIKYASIGEASIKLWEVKIQELVDLITEKIE